MRNSLLARPLLLNVSWFRGRRRMMRRPLCDGAVFSRRKCLSRPMAAAGSRSLSA